MVGFRKFALGVPAPLNEPGPFAIEARQVRPAPDEAAPVQIDDLMITFSRKVIVAAADIRVDARKENLSARGCALDVGQPEILPMLVAGGKLKGVFRVSDRVEIQVARVVRMLHAIRGNRVVEAHECHRHVVDRETPVLQLFAHIERAVVQRNMNKVPRGSRASTETERVDFNLFDRPSRVQLRNVGHKPIKARPHFRHHPGYSGAERHTFRNVSAVGLRTDSLDVVMLPDILHIRILTHRFLAFGDIGGGAVIACRAGREVTLNPDMTGRRCPCIHAVVPGAVEKYHGTDPLRRWGRRIVRTTSLANCRIHNLYLNQYRAQAPSKL